MPVTINAGRTGQGGAAGSLVSTILTDTNAIGAIRTAETTTVSPALWSITLPAGSMDMDSVLRIGWTYTSAGTITLSRQAIMQVNGVQVWAQNHTGQGGHGAQIVVANRGSLTSQVVTAFASAFAGSNSNHVGTAAVDTAQALTITGHFKYNSAATANDFMKHEFVTVELLK